MRKKYVSLALNISAMLLVIIGRLLSNKGFDWMATIAFIIMLLSIYSVIKLYRETK
ncbi:MAG: hypothetical protein ACPG6B_00530 [Oceanihabitans sp.]